MERADILDAILPPRALPLWIPLLTPYREAVEQGTAVDASALALHARALRGVTPLWMASGSTGDGWELDDTQWAQLLEAIVDPDFRSLGGRTLVAVLRPTTAEVHERLDALHSLLGTRPDATVGDNLRRALEHGIIGVCLCPPVDPDADQGSILEHYRTLIEHAALPIALYQLPQVTGCRIEPSTFDELIARHRSIVLFKDSSGEDTIAAAAGPAPGPLLVRGAESRYADALRGAGGPYDGLLLSTANSSGPALAELVHRVLDGRIEEARTISDALQRLWSEIFPAVAEAPVGNAFANANRAVVHLLHHGAAWSEHPRPLLFDGSRLPDDVLTRVWKVIESWNQPPFAPAD